MAAEVGSRGSEVTPDISMGPPADVEQLRAYLLRVVPVLLEEDVLPNTSELEALLKSAEARLRHFIEDPQERVVFILRTIPPEEEGEGGTGGEAPSFHPTYEVRLGLTFRPARSVGVAFLKRSAILEAEKSVRAQLRVMNISEDSPFETLHAYIRDAVTPFFTSYVHVSKKTGYAPLVCSQFLHGHVMCVCVASVYNSLCLNEVKCVCVGFCFAIFR